MKTLTITATEIMTRRLIFTSPETHVIDALEKLVAYKISGMPVIDRNGQFVGRFTERCAIAALDLGGLCCHSNVAARLRDVKASELMNRSTLVLKSDQDVFHGINELVTRKVSGAPVLDVDGCLQGVFSEQSAMHVFIGLCWEQLPSSRVSSWIDRHDGRQIGESTGLDEIIDRFQQTAYRRLMVVRNDQFMGQVTRQDALQAALKMNTEPLAASRLLTGAGQIGLKTSVAAWMHGEAASISHTDDVLTIAQRFLNSNARQLPVLEDGRIDGQISRCDLLKAVQKFFPETNPTDGKAQPLYLTSIGKRNVHAVT